MQAHLMEAERFYRVWSALLHYARRPDDDQELEIYPYRADDPEWVAAVHKALLAEDSPRNRLWADDSLREAFIAENPAGLDADDLALVDSWQHRVAGRFLYLPHLPEWNGPALLIDEQDVGYLVHGITEPLHEAYPPLGGVWFMHTVLLPFEDRIIFDGVADMEFSPPWDYDRSACTMDRNMCDRGDAWTRLPVDATPDVARVRRGNQNVLRVFRRMSHDQSEYHTNNLAVLAETVLERMDPPVFLRDVSPDLFVQLMESGDIDRQTLYLLADFMFFREDYEQADTLMAIWRGYKNAGD